MVSVCEEKEQRKSVRMGRVPKISHYQTYGNQFAVGELAHNGRGLVALLLLRQLVAIQGDDTLDLAAIQSLLIELLAQLEADGRGLECGCGGQGVGITILSDLHGGADSVAHFAQHHADA